MAKLFKWLKGIYRVFNALKDFYNSIKSGIALLKMPLAGWALIAVAAFVIYSVATNYEELRSAISQLRSYYVSKNAPASEGPAIETSITKDDPQWMRKYCDEQLAKLPAPPFKFNKKTVEGIWLTLPSLEVGSRMPKNEKGYRVDSVTCRLIYGYNQKEAFPSMDVEYKFDIKAINEFQKRVDEIYSLSMDPTWEKIVLDKGEGGSPFYAYQGFPLVFKRENPKLGTVEYARMSFAIDFWVSFTVYEKTNNVNN